MGAIASSPEQWLSCPVARPHARATLVCFPYAGAGVAAYAPWGRRLDPRMELHIVALPGRGRRLREAPERRLDVVLSALCAAFSSLPDRPTVFMGHSLGAMLAYESVRLLWERGGLSLIHI